MCLLLLACSHKNPSNWSTEHLETGNEAFDSTRFAYESQDRTYGLGLEIIKQKKYSKGYIIVHSQAIPSLAHDIKKSLVQISINSKTYTYEATRYAGGQKLLLPPEATFLILENTSSSIHIKLSGYQETLSPIPN